MDPYELSLGAGVFYLDIFEGGQPTGEVDLGEVSGADLSSTVETATKYSSRTSVRRIAREAVTQQGAALTITVDSFSDFNLAVFTQGEVRSLVQAASTVTAEALTAKVKLGRYFPTAKRQISAVVVHQGAATLVADTDYTIDARTGRIYFMPGGAAVEDTPATVDYAAAVLDLPQVVAGVKRIIEGRLRFIGDPSAGPELEVLFRKINIKPSGNLPLISPTEFGSYQLNVTCLDDSATDPENPYYTIIRHGKR